MGQIGRLQQVNRELKRMGREERLCRAKGYFYFWFGDAINWYSASIYVSHASELTLEQWLEEFRIMDENHKAMMGM